MLIVNEVLRFTHSKKSILAKSSMLDVRMGSAHASKVVTKITDQMVPRMNFACIR